MTATIFNSQVRLRYGAIELKEFASRRTFVSFFLALGTLSLLFFAYALYHTVPVVTIPVISDIPVIQVERNLPPIEMEARPARGAQQKGAPPPKPDVPDQVPIVPIDDLPDIPIPVPVEDDLVRDSDDSDLFETEPSEFPTAPVGPNPDGNAGAASGELGPSTTIGSDSAEVIARPYGEFNPDVRLPDVDLKDIQSRIEYPAIALRAGIEGKVSLRVLLDPNGVPVRHIVERSDNDIFVEPAVSVIMDTRFQPAMNNGIAVYCWISIPIDFRLR